MSVQYHDERVEDPNFLRLISYPRTGSHWFRIIMELYTRKPSMLESFFNKEEDFDDCWGYHMHNRYVDKPHNEPGFGKGSHEILLHKELTKVIYLYRNPVDTIYSQLRYDDDFDIENFNNVSEEYYNHLQAWRFEHEVDEIIFIDYDDIKNNPHDVFQNVFSFINKGRGRGRAIRYNSLRLDKVLKQSTKEKTQFVTTTVGGHGGNPRTICEEQLLDRVNYEKHKKEWSEKWSDEIIEMFKGVYYE